jgi:hypothetical protein
MSPFGHDERRDTAEPTDRDTMLSTERPFAERRMKVALVLVVGMIVWVGAREARRDAEVLQSRPDIGTEWTSRRGRRGR